MIKKQSSFIVLYSDDISSTKHFFERLECTIIEDEKDKCVVQCGDLELHYVTTEPLKQYQFIKQQKTDSKGLILYIEVDNIQRYKDIIANNTGKILSEIQSTPWGTSEFLFNDPNGYHFVLYENR